MSHLKKFKSLEDYVDYKYPFNDSIMRVVKRDSKLYNKVFEREAKEYKKYLESLERMETIPIFYKMGLIS